MKIAHYRFKDFSFISKFWNTLNKLKLVEPMGSDFSRSDNKYIAAVNPGDDYYYGGGIVVTWDNEK